MQAAPVTALSYNPVTRTFNFCFPPSEAEHHSCAEEKIKNEKEMESQRQRERQAVLLSKSKPHGERWQRRKHKWNVGASPSERLSQTDRETDRQTHMHHHCSFFEVNSYYMEAGGLIESNRNKQTAWKPPEFRRLPHYKELNMDGTFYLNFMLS